MDTVRAFRLCKRTKSSLSRLDILLVNILNIAWTHTIGVKELLNQKKCVSQPRVAISLNANENYIITLKTDAPLSK